MASEWAQQRLRKWLDEVVDLNQRQTGFRIPELLDEVRKETAARCAEIAGNRCEALRPAPHILPPEAQAVGFIANEIRREFGLEE